MESEPVKRTKLEEMLYQKAKYDIYSNKYEDAISLIKHLLRIKPHHPLYYLMLGDCYRGANQAVRALTNYRKALDNEGEIIPLDDNFRRDVERRIITLEIDIGVRLAYSAGLRLSKISWAGWR
jgi:tetratricopeptide (TPR) repeat protein